ncbi:MAG: putative reductase [Candidatus Doudnabacteria bacterium]|nr:putative reductase [Candidatus Doudnabacteria bacterium]
MNLYSVELLSRKQVTSKLYDLKVRLIEPNTMVFKAGQCVGFQIAEKEKRLYSIASVPERPNELSFCVDVSHMGVGSQFILALNIGERFTIEGPYGAFTVNDESHDLLFIATGAGIAPFKSIIAQLLSKNYPKDITLLFGVRSEEDKIYFDFFEKLSQENHNFFFIPTFSQPKGVWNGAKGRVTNFIEENYEAYKDHRPYICGSPVMVKEVRALLMAKGKEAREIKLELFS